jgi:hypothetical protein
LLPPFVFLGTGLEILEGVLAFVGVGLTAFFAGAFFAAVFIAGFFEAGFTAFLVVAILIDFFY